MHPLGVTLTSEGEVQEALKKRRLNPISYPYSSLNKAKSLSKTTTTNSSILDFNFSLSQISQAPGLQSVGKEPANNTTLTEDSIINNTPL